MELKGQCESVRNKQIEILFGLAWYCLVYRQWQCNHSRLKDLIYKECPKGEKTCFASTIRHDQSHFSVRHVHYITLIQFS